MRKRWGNGKLSLESEGLVGGPPRGSLAQGLRNFIMVYSDLLMFQPMLY